MRIIGIITTKDRDNLFSNAINSAVAQSRELDELIVVSDSNDENFECEKVICQKYNAVLIKNKYAHNYAGSLNTAIHGIISDRLFKAYDFSDIYIAFLDDDDSWHENYIDECEKSIMHNEDFVISGINYCNEDGTKTLSISQKIEIGDFLKGNPHIQGSNTFIKFSTLLKSGMFDENMPSTTDRDLFVRVMLLNPSYTVINKWLVDINAYNARERITNSTVKKAEGLKKFYYKYGGLMSNEIKTAFFERAERMFQVKWNEIEKTAQTHISSKKIYCNAKKYCGKLTIGFIATEYKLGLRLLKQLIALKRKKTKILVLINFTNNTYEYENLLKQSGYTYKLITHDRLLKDIKNYSLAGLVVKNQIEKIPICDIAVSRSLLQHYLYCNTKEGDVVWVLDDDMELYDLMLEANSLSKNKADIDGTIEKYRNAYDAVRGNYAVDAPLPTL
jgi:glycosyltransferase involved in cell wall biosynthesis